MHKKEETAPGTATLHGHRSESAAREKKNTAQVRLVSPNVLILSVGFDSVTESAKIKVGYYLIWVWTFDLGELKSPSSGFKLFGLGMVHISGGEYILFDS